jgi:replicative DNA helicase
MNIQDLPNEVMAVMTLLGSSDKARGLLAATLRLEHFHDSRAKEIYTRIMAMAKRRKELPGWDTMQHDTLLTPEARQLLDSSSYPPAKTEGDAEQILEILEKMRQGRVILATYDAVMDVMKEETADPIDAFTLIEQGLREARTDQSDETLAIGMDGNFLPAVAALLNRKRPDTIPTGFHEFDNSAGGLPRGGLTTLAASSGGGKSCMAVQICVNAFNAGYSCAIVTLEMSKEQTTGRLSANLSGVDYKAINLAKLNDMQKTRISKATAAFQAKAETAPFPRIDVYHRTNISFSEIALEMRALKYDLIIVDYINLLNREEDASTNSNDAAILGEISKSAKAQAGATKTAWVMLAQLNEQGDVKYSKAIKENSDYMLTWTYGDAEKESHLVEINIAKARHSQSFKFPLRENFKNQRFENAGGPDRNADVAVRKGRKRKAERHPTAKPMPGMAWEDDNDDDL